MSELKQFLRFEISGFIVIMYAFLFIITFFDLTKIKNVFDKNILDASIISLVVAAPLGYIMHQIDIIFFNPFDDKVWGVNRKAIDKLKKCTEDDPILKKIERSQMKLEILKCLYDFKKEKFNCNYFQKEISDRYSYYYSRIEASVFSPIFGFIIFLIIAEVYRSNWGNPFIETNLENKFWVILGVFSLSMIILSYCKQIIEEIDDLEYYFVCNYFKK